MDYYQGERVRCLGRPEWGAGIIETNSRDGKVQVLFHRAGRKLLCIRYARLLKVKPAAPDRAPGRLPPGSRPRT